VLWDSFHSRSKQWQSWFRADLKPFLQVLAVKKTALNVEKVFPVDRGRCFIILLLKPRLEVGSQRPTRLTWTSAEMQQVGVNFSCCEQHSRFKPSCWNGSCSFWLNGTCAALAARLSVLVGRVCKTSSGAFITFRQGTPSLYAVKCCQKEEASWVRRRKASRVCLCWNKQQNSASSYVWTTVITTKLCPTFSFSCLMALSLWCCCLVWNSHKI